MKNSYKLSTDFQGALMIALQNALFGETDISDEIEQWEIVLADGELKIVNPPYLIIPEGFGEECDCEEKCEDCPSAE